MSETTLQDRELERAVSAVSEALVSVDALLDLVGEMRSEINELREAGDDA